MYGVESEFLGIFLKLIFALAGGLAIGFFLKFVVFGSFKRSRPMNTEKPELPPQPVDDNQIEEIRIRYARRGNKDDKNQQEIDEYHV